MNDVREAAAEAAVQTGAAEAPAKVPRSAPEKTTKAAPKARRRRKKCGGVTPFREGKGWAVRLRVGGRRLYLSGYPTEDQARAAASEHQAAHRKGGVPFELPEQATVADALQAMGRQTLPFMKGAEQEARRITKYLRAAEIDTLKVRPVAPGAAGRSKKSVYFDVELEPFEAQRVIPKGLSTFRGERANATAKSNELREVLALTPLAEVTRAQVQAFVNQLRSDGLEPATIELERAVLRKLFHYARRTWGWPGLAINPASELVMPKVDNQRDRVLSGNEQERLNEVLRSRRNSSLRPSLTLLWETGARVSEMQQTATWDDVDWDRRVIRLRDSKSGRRDVPLSPAAMDALRELQALHPQAQPSDPVVPMSYNALAAAWRRACKEAGVDGLRLHDLRHTAATRLALRTGNVFVVQTLTGHRTLNQLARYVNVKADDVAALLHGQLSTGPESLPGTARTPHDTTVRVTNVRTDVGPLQREAA